MKLSSTKVDPKTVYTWGFQEPLAVRLYNQFVTKEHRGELTPFATGIGGPPCIKAPFVT